MRFHTIPNWLKRFYPGAVWNFADLQGKIIYLTFDDGPNPATTPWLLDLLDQHHAKATFFCTGKQVQEYPGIYEELICRGHAVGNHGMQHINSFSVSQGEYLNDVKEAGKLIKSNLFRPAYGKMTRAQFRQVKQLGYRVVFWTLMPYDFDATFSSAKRLEIIRKKTKAGSIIVLHDSEKAFPQLKKELPVLLNEWRNAGYSFGVIQ